MMWVVCAPLKLTWSGVVLVMVLVCSNTVSGGKGDSDGDGCRRGLAGTDGDGLGVRNDTGGDRIPANNGRNETVRIRDMYQPKCLCFNRIVSACTSPSKLNNRSFSVYLLNTLSHSYTKYVCTHVGNIRACRARARVYLHMKHTRNMLTSLTHSQTTVLNIAQRLKRSRRVCDEREREREM